MGKLKSILIGVQRDPCPAKLKIVERGEIIEGGEEGMLYCCLERGHPGSHKAMILWEGTD